MTPVLQTIFHSPDPNDPRGDCWRACIASLTDKPLEEVPHFVEMDKDTPETNWFNATLRWLEANGMALRYYSWNEVKPDNHYLVTGRSYRFDGHHAVVYRGRNLAHDPFPDGMGVHTPTGIYGIEKT